MFSRTSIHLIAVVLAMAAIADAEDVPEAEKKLSAACITGEGPGWREMVEEEFVNVNLDPDTFTWKDGTIYSKGTPVGVLRTKDKYTNFEMVLEWRHMKSGGNAGVFLWIQDETLEGLKPGQLPPGGIEVQILDHGYTEKYEQESGKKADWFTSHGDVFPVGTSDMKPFPPVAPDGKRSFPTKNLSKGVEEWNHYYIRAINGEVRLWVNGEEVSGGTNCTPSNGYLALESEGSPVEIKNLRIRPLP